jgi:two-component system phosphate regulon sensor histidine kinase PhoR
MVKMTLDNGEVSQGDIALYQAGERILDAHCNPLFDAAGERMGALLVMSDVTQLRRLETMRSDFAANVSHEIKTPLTAIQGFVETLCQEGDVDPLEVKRFLGIIDKHVKRLTAIVDDLMQLARLEQGAEQPALNLSRVPVQSMLYSARQLCHHKAEEKSMRVEITCDETLTMPTDADLMEQAIVNLLDNAIKYSPPDGRIELSAQTESNRLRIRVKDEGIGISKKHLPRLFERFYRVDKARSRRMGGTGLGLAIVKHIVQAHNGQVTVESELGKGSTFTITLPLTPAG